MAFFRARKTRSRLSRALLPALPLAMAAVVFGTSTAQADPPRGIDASSFQHVGNQPIDWAKVRAAGITFAYIKATEGRDYLNPWFNQDVDAMTANGIFHGAYHFPDYHDSPELQAIWYVTQVWRADSKGALPPSIAVERSEGASAPQIINWLHRWLTEVQMLTGRTPVIYTTAFWRNGVANDPGFAQYPLWIADWGQVSSPHLVGPWKNWLFWQTSDHATIDGVPSSVDTNVFNGDYEALRRLATEPFHSALPIPMGSSIPKFPIPSGSGS